MKHKALFNYHREREIERVFFGFFFVVVDIKTYYV